MTDENFKRSLEAFIRRRPFKAFAIELASGDRFTVDHPEGLAHRGTVAVYIDRGGNYTLFDSTGVTQLTDFRGDGGKALRRRT